jgi:DNA ligase D-like protein (predicted polymerase)
VAGDALVLELDGQEVRVSSPDKVVFEDTGRDEARPHPLLRGRRRAPATRPRRPAGPPAALPEGAGGSSFWQKRIPDTAPPWLQTTTVSTVNGTTSRALVLADLAHVAWAVNIGCLGFHVWPHTAADPEHADELRLDLDPSPGTDFEDVRAAAAVLKDLLDEHGVRAWPKTTGNRGLHVYVRLQPRWDSYAVRSAAVAVARELERRRPEILTAAWWKEERGERVFVDFNQNAPHKTVFGAWCVRARPGAPVSCPLRWDDLADVHPDDLTLATVPARVAERGDPWAGIDEDPSRSTGCSSCTSATWRPACPTRPGRPSTRRCRARPRAWRPPGPARPRADRRLEGLAAEHGTITRLGRHSSDDERRPLRSCCGDGWPPRGRAARRPGGTMPPHRGAARCRSRARAVCSPGRRPGSMAR